MVLFYNMRAYTICGLIYVRNILHVKEGGLEFQFSGFSV